MRIVVALSFVVLLSTDVHSQDDQLPAGSKREAVSAPTYVNARVMRVNSSAALVTLQKASGAMLTARWTGASSTFRPGAPVIAAYREVVDSSGRTTFVITYMRPASSSSGEPENILTATTAWPGSASEPLR
jgi:hypothetical protein